MTIWITGTTGFIGRHFARGLADAGENVHGVGHGAISPAEVKSLGLGEWVSGDIDADNLDRLAARAGKPTLVFHLAGGASVGLSIARPQEDFLRTVRGTEQLLEWLCRAAPGCRLVAVSSAAVYGAAHRGPIAESAELAPISPYGRHKRMMEELCARYAAAHGVRSVVVRLFSVFGPGLRKQLLWDLCCRMRAGERTLVFGGTGGEVRDWMEVRDVARLLALLGSHDEGARFRVLNGGSGVGTAVAVIAERVAQYWGSGVAVRFSGETRPGDPPSLVADCTELRSLGFQPRVELEEGIERYVRWFKEREC